MASHSTDLNCQQQVGRTRLWTCGHIWQMLPVTMTVVLGPFITIVYRLTQPADAGPGGLSLAQVIRGCLCILMFLVLVFSGRLRLLEHRLIRPLLFLAIYAGLTAVISPYPYENIVFAVRLGFIALVFANAFLLAEEGWVSERWLATCAWIVLIVMALCIGTGLAAGMTVAVYGSRYATAGVIGQPFVASCLVLSVLPVLVRFVSNGFSSVFGMALLFASVFFTMCRNALVAAAAATFSAFLISLRSLGRRAWRRRILVPIGALVVLAGIGLYSPPGAHLIGRFKDLNPFGGTGSGRYVFWRMSLEHILDRPMRAQLLGEGMGSIRDVLKARFGMAIPAHNDWLDLATAFGLCGVVGLGWWCFELARLTWRLRDRPNGVFQGACAALIVLGLISMGTGGGFDPAWGPTYAALGFWAGCGARDNGHHRVQLAQGLGA